MSTPSSRPFAQLDGQIGRAVAETRGNPEELEALMWFLQNWANHIGRVYLGWQ